MPHTYAVSLVAIDALGKAHLDWTPRRSRIGEAARIHSNETLTESDDDIQYFYTTVVKGLHAIYAGRDEIQDQLHMYPSRAL